MRIGAAMSRTDEAGIAAAEAADAAAQDVGGDVRFAVVFASGAHGAELASVGAAVAARLAPSAMIGGAAQGVVGGAAEVEGAPAVSVWCAAWDGAPDVVTFRSSVLRTPEGVAVVGWPDTTPDDAVILLADPHTFPAGHVVSHLARERPGHRVCGGLVTPGLVTGAGPGSLLVHDGQGEPEVLEDGAVGVTLRGAALELVVSQGCRPVGEPYVVTAAEGNLVLELGGEPAIRRLHDTFASADADDRRLMQRGLQVGLVADEYRDEFATGDFLIRAVLGADEERGSIAVGDHVEVGQVLQFQVRDARSAHRDLLRALDGRAPAAGALLFTCNGRGQGFFGEPDHDARLVTETVTGNLAGAFCAGEIGPVGPRSYVHGFTASLAIFDA